MGEAVAGIEIPTRSASIRSRSLRRRLKTVSTSSCNGMSASSRTSSQRRRTKWQMLVPVGLPAAQVFLLGRCPVFSAQSAVELGISGQVGERAGERLAVAGRPVGAGAFLLGQAVEPAADGHDRGFACREGIEEL